MPSYCACCKISSRCSMTLCPLLCMLTSRATMLMQSRKQDKVTRPWQTNKTTHFTTLHSSSQHFTTLHNTSQHFKMLHKTSQHFTTLQNASQNFTTLQKTQHFTRPNTSQHFTNKATKTLPRGTGSHNMILSTSVKKIL